jgi:Group II intron, maturase-specific domain
MVSRGPTAYIYEFWALLPLGHPSAGLGEAATDSDWRREIRSWHIVRRSDEPLGDLARIFNSIVQGWINYYGRFYKSMLYPFCGASMITWCAGAMPKYKRLRRREKRAGELLAKASRRSPQLFAHWRIGLKPDGWTMGAG